MNVAEQMQRPGVVAPPLLSHNSDHLIEKFECQSIQDQSIRHPSFIQTTMPPSASKQKRLAEKAAKKNAGVAGDDSPSTSTPAGSVNGGASTPLTSMSGLNSKTGSQEDLTSMAKLSMATDR